MLTRSFHIALLLYATVMLLAYALKQDNLLKGVIPVIISLIIYYLVSVQLKLFELLGRG